MKCNSLRGLLCAVFLCAAVPAVCSGATVSVYCVPLGCYGGATPSYATAVFSAVGPSGWVDARSNSASTYGSPWTQASAAYEATLQIVFEGGTGSGYYAPDVMAAAAVTRVGGDATSGSSATATATFGPIGCYAYGGPPSMCRSDATHTIPFVLANRKRRFYGCMRLQPREAYTPEKAMHRPRLTCLA
jgi:hypothetical protein